MYRAGGSSNGRTRPFEGWNFGSIPSPPAVCRKVYVLKLHKNKKPNEKNKVMYILYYQHHTDYWTAISVVVSALTVIVSCWVATRIHKQTKYLEYSSRPTAYFLLFRNLMYIKNTSNFLIKFYFKMGSGDEVFGSNHWEDNKRGPLFIYPGAGFMRFPQAFDCEKLITGKIKIEYKVIPSHINDAGLYKDTQVVEWSYNALTKKWIAPNGIEELGILSFLPPDEQVNIKKDFSDLR